MAKDYLNQAPTDMRRDDRAMKDERWIVDFLNRAAVGTLATVLEGQPFLNANLFVFDADRRVIYMHTAKVGRTRANVENAQKVCFSVHEMGRMLPADEALEFSVEYAGVVVFGTASVIKNPERAKEALQMLLDKYAPHLKPGRDYRATTDEELKRTSVFEIQIDQWSGKKKVEEEDFPGAYLFKEVGLAT